jgi:phage terminase large subunit
LLQLRADLPAYAEGLFIPKRYKVYYGGRGAARSWSFARALLIKGAQQRLRLLCVREFQKSIADSVHKLLVDQIELLQMPGWTVTQRLIEHAGTGTTFIFEGLRYNTNRIKSLEGIDICWVEEAESVSKDSWELLIPTIRKEGSEIWISFNPDVEEDPTYQRFVVNRPPNAIVQKVGWEDNPWFPETLAEERDYLYRVDPEAADHVWGGEPRRASEAQILAGKWRVEAFEPEGHWVGPLFGGDFGFAEDPSTLVELYIHKKKGVQGVLYLRRESWHVKLDIHKMIPQWNKDIGVERTLRGRVIRADSARPETISYLKQHGLQRIQPVFKWPGSVEDGIAYLRGFEEIIIHPSCKHAREEARLYSYKVDKHTGDILPEVKDAHNHIWDAVRYALAPMIRQKRMPKSTYSGMTYVNKRA